MVNNHGKDDDIVSDPTDWKPTRLPALFAVDAALRCQVCKDFYNTPMMTKCSHTFCSTCIRRCLSADPKCPACRNATQEKDLRTNWVLEEVVSAYVAAREDIIVVAREETSGRSRKRKIAEIVPSTMQDGEKRSKRVTRQSSRMSSQPQLEEVLMPMPHSVVEDSDKDYDDEEDMNADVVANGASLTPNDGLVACPMDCGRRMKEADVFFHIDKCNGQAAATLPTPQSPSLRQVSKPANDLSRLPSLSYSLLKDNALRKKLNELGIPAHGNRLELEARHKEWLTLWNANCDAALPNTKTKRQLLLELDRWERNINKGQSGSKNIDIRSKDFDRDAYSVSSNDDFKALIVQARSKKSQPVADDTKICNTNAEAAITNGTSDHTILRKPAVEDSTTSNSDKTPPSLGFATINGISGTLMKPAGTMNTTPCRDGASLHSPRPPQDVPNATKSKFFDEGVHHLTEIVNSQESNA